MIHELWKLCVLLRKWDQSQPKVFHPQKPTRHLYLRELPWVHFRTFLILPTSHIETMASKTTVVAQPKLFSRLRPKKTQLARRRMSNRPSKSTKRTRKNLGTARFSWSSHLGPQTGLRASIGSTIFAKASKGSHQLQHLLSLGWLRGYPLRIIGRGTKKMCQPSHSRCWPRIWRTSWWRARETRWSSAWKPQIPFMSSLKPITLKS